MTSPTKLWARAFQVAFSCAEPTCYLYDIVGLAKLQSQRHAIVAQVKAAETYSKGAIIGNEEVAARVHFQNGMPRLFPCCSAFQCNSM